MLRKRSRNKHFYWRSSGIASKTGNLGSAYFCLGEYQKAIEYYEKGLEISTAIGDLSGIASNNGNLGLVYLILGEYRKAIEYCEKGLEISTDIGEQLSIATINVALGIWSSKFRRARRSVIKFDQIN